MTPADIARVLDLSDERDQWAQRLIDAERAGYIAGWRAGRDAHRAAVIGADLELMIGRPELADLEARRWGTAGREHFADPRPGDYIPPAKSEAA